MGASYSTCEAPVNAAFGTLPTDKDQAKETARRFYVRLPQPAKYEEIQREAFGALKWESIEGAKFDVTRPLNQNFFLSHRMGLGMRDVDVGDPTKVLRTPASDYSFTATVANDKWLLLGTMTHGGILMSKAVVRVTDELSAKYESRVSPDAYDQPMFMGDLDYAAGDFNAQIKYGLGGFLGVNYMQSVTQNLSTGAEAFWLAAQGRSGMGLATRFANEKIVATAQAATTGILSLTYHQKLNDKAAVAADFLVNFGNMSDANASVGYDYQFKQCRLRGSIDSHGKVSALLEEQLGPAFKLLLSAELDHWRQDHKFGFGMTFGE